MFCSNCGTVLADGAKFCSSCGAKCFVPQNDSTITEVTQAETVFNKPISTNAQVPMNMVFNRDVLNNYMYNIRTLEVAKSRLLAEKQNVSYRISTLVDSICISRWRWLYCCRINHRNIIKGNGRQMV